MRNSIGKLNSDASLYQLDPLRDPRWERFVDGHSEGSVFHSTNWIEALHKTYSYEPIVYTATPPDRELENGVVFCRISSWLTGRRLVSLPFSDHCDPLANGPNELEELITSLTRVLEYENSEYIELRPHITFTSDRNGFKPSQAFYSHSIDLRPSMEDLFCNFHKNCVQRKIHRANRECLNYEEGGDQSLLHRFYDLLLLTRRRHQLPPQPLAWFRNLMHCMTEQAKIRICSKNGRPIAAIITLSHKNSMVYKYGCSDARFHNLGGMPYLFWKAIQDAKQSGLTEMDLGRSDCDDEGLVNFKERLGGSRALVTYWTYPATTRRLSVPWKERLSRSFFGRMPDGLLSLAGKLLYRHIG